MDKALMLSGDKSSPTVDIRPVAIESLPVQGDTLVRVAWSSLNYKDGLAITGKGKIIRASMPFVPGIDLVGQVEKSGSEEFDVGDWVIGTGWGIGEAHWGGYSSRQWLDSAWLVPKPPDLSPRQAMTAGTAGLTAMLAVSHLERNGLQPDNGPVVVSGASGGVGSFAVAILSHLGYEVFAATGKADAHDYLRQLGAASVMSRTELSKGPAHPLESAKWAGAVDSVGSTTLSTILAQLQPHGSVAACGLAGGPTLDTTVFPFILRGANLLGVDSNTCPNNVRRVLWDKLASLMNSPDWQEVGLSIELEELPSYAAKIVRGEIRGRILVQVDG